MTQHQRAIDEAEEQPAVWAHITISRVIDRQCECERGERRPLPVWFAHPDTVVHSHVELLDKVRADLPEKECPMLAITIRNLDQVLCVVYHAAI